MKLFENYLNGLKGVLENNGTTTKQFSARSRVTDMLSKSNEYLFEGLSTSNFSGQPQLGNFDIRSKSLFNFDKAELEKYFGKNKASFSEITIGSHPDFKHLGHDQYEYHHCVSMFVDIKGSTLLSLKHSLEEVRLIKDSLLTLCIHVANFFGGHVHRLQGDAAFIQFVRRDLYSNDSIINALNAATILCQFVTNDLSTLFKQKDLNPIKIRVGIDYGPNEKVLWSHYGIPGCNELTTTSLHTDLAAKLQAKAPNNSIRIGKNIVDALDLPTEFYSTPYIKNNGNDEADYYVLSTSDFRYNQYVFEWGKYLNGFSFIRKNSEGVLELQKSVYEIRCTLDSAQNQVNQYFQNSFSIPKYTSLKYELYFNGSLYNIPNSEDVTWQIFNRGKEAIAANLVELTCDSKRSNNFEATASYLGHHILRCTIKKQFLSNVVLNFPIYVQ